MGIDAVQDKKVFKSWNYPIFVLFSLLSFSAIGYFFCYWFSLNDLFDFPLFYSIVTSILIVILINNQGRWFLLLFMKKPEQMAIESNWRVAVVTSIVPQAESIEMLELH
jgi:hypothetical protein